VIISMPGVPHEMFKMWADEAEPRLARLISGGAIVSRLLKLAGIGESHAEEALGELTRSANPTLATYAKSDGIHLRLTAKAATRPEAEALLDAFEPLVTARVADHVYGGANDSLASVVGALLRVRGLKLAVAESATGGQLASLITDAAGASDYFVAGYVVYSAAAKQALGVSPAILAAHGTIAAETTRALAAAARRAAGADVAIATTGNAGPNPAEDKPVGLLHIVVDVQGHQTCHETRYSTTRAEYKRRAAQEALYLLWRELKNAP
jgi:nicotinamide-nucleotide amidase